MSANENHGDRHAAKGPRRPTTARVMAAIGLAAALLAAAGAATSGLGYRWEIWALGSAFNLLRWSAYGGAVAACLSLLGLILAWWSRHRPTLVVGVLGLSIGLVVAAIPYHHLRIARSVPPIHDITTDTENPPQFDAILAERAGAPNSSEYGGPAVAEHQRQAYPDIGPLVLGISPRESFDRALDVVDDLGWRLVASNVDSGRIEAVDRTFWFGFEDDVVVRIRAEADGSRVDVRSVSRVGRSDIGANARRIRHFLGALAMQSDPP